MTSVKDVVLEPCPFCGSRGGMLTLREHWVECDICETEGPFGQKGDRAAAAEAWNTRLSSLPTHGEDVVELLIPHIGREVDIRTEGLVSALIPICEAYDLNDCAERDEEDALEISIGDLRCLIDALAALDSGAIARSALSVLDQEVVEALRLDGMRVYTEQSEFGPTHYVELAFSTREEAEACADFIDRISQGEGG